MSILKITEKNWGKEELIYQGHGYAVKKIHLSKNKKTSLHYHEKKCETIMLIEGEIIIELRENLDAPTKVINLKFGESITIEPNIIHRMKSLESNSIYFEAQTDYLDDVIRLEID